MFHSILKIRRKLRNARTTSKWCFSSNCEKIFLITFSEKWNRWRKSCATYHNSSIILRRWNSRPHPLRALRYSLLLSLCPECKILTHHKLHTTLILTWVTPTCLFFQLQHDKLSVSFWGTCFQEKTSERPCLFVITP